MGHIKVLLAEDDSTHRWLLLRALARGRSSVDVVAASTREDLLRAARRSHFDCIVLDYNLEPYRATELASDLAPLQRGVPIIVISSSAAQQVVVEALRQGVADFVPKDEALRGGALWSRIRLAVASSRKLKREQRVANRRLQKIKREAETDPLTGLQNRRFVERAIESILSRGDRRAQTSLIMFDLDHFKGVNDTLGHDAGDAVLRDVAGVIRAHASPSDIVARWGGEEFLILRQSDTLTDAWIWADGLRRAIPEGVSVEDGWTITASMGVDVSATTSVDADAISRADRAMYLAKDSGRDRVCTWNMVAAIDIACDLQTNPSLSAAQRLAMLVDRLRDTLGATQLGHVGPHGLAVRDVAMNIGRGLVNDPEQLAMLELAAQYHDVGKIGIPEQLLSLPRRLNDDERRMINEHARFGADILRACGAPEPAAEAVEHHHARFDGGVFVEAKGGEEPSLASIISACDALVAMTGTRAYATACTPTQALAELRAERGAQFHPDVVDTLQFVDQARLVAA